MNFKGSFIYLTVPLCILRVPLFILRFLYLSYGSFIYLTVPLFILIFLYLS